jgi:hypothetical protein
MRVRVLVVVDMHDAQQTPLRRAARVEREPVHRVSVGASARGVRHHIDCRGVLVRCSICSRYLPIISVQIVIGVFVVVVLIFEPVRNYLITYAVRFAVPGKHVTHTHTLSLSRARAQPSPPC